MKLQRFINTLIYFVGISSNIFFVVYILLNTKTANETMPSKNSVNRPKLTVNLNKKSQKYGLKRARRERSGAFQPSRSSENSKSGEVKSVALDLFFANKKNEKPVATGNNVTTRTLSKKRFKKIQRNLKYAEQRKLLVDLQSKHDEEMDMDMESTSGKNKKGNGKEKTSLAKMKDALWEVLEDASTQPLTLSNGQGTTLGGPVFP